ncbi:hypothetical protein P0136_02190 [Lentisphaerota bacterium ZTH]|nr:hypothetical protein JYG24_06670 [Lentisphaerota bacterium]WET06816.1 hypothetical protein P0136_02190 [Lentisphaerota bacterium ZTH]
MRKNFSGKETYHNIMVKVYSKNRRPQNALTSEAEVNDEIEASKSLADTLESGCSVFLHMAFSSPWHHTDL